MANDLTSYRVFGFKITPMTDDDILALVARAVAAERQVVIASQNTHGMYVYLTEDAFRTLHERPDTYVHIDGTPLVWLGKLFGLPVSMKHRTAVIDWLTLLLRRARERQWRVFYLGSNGEVCQRGLRRLRDAVPGVALDGRDGYFDATHGSADNQALIAQINAYRPHVLLVGMGMGRQERWIVENADALQVNCIATIGACMELVAGALPMAPRWLGTIGMEWAFRLLSSPRRVGWRYLGEPWVILWLLLRNRIARSFGGSPERT